MGSALLALLVHLDGSGAVTFLDEAIAELRGVGEFWGLGIVLSVAAGLHVIRGDFAEARACATEALRLHRELEDPRGIAWSLDILAGLLAPEGDAEEAARVWGAADRLLDSVGGALVPTIAWVRDRYLPPAAAAVSQPVFEAARAEGRAMRTEQVLALVEVARA